MSKVLVSLFAVFFLPVHGSIGHSQHVEDCRTDAYPPHVSTKVNWEVIDLDLPPRERFLDLGQKYAPQMQALLTYFKNFTSFILDGKLFGIIDKDLAWIVNYLPYPYGDEIIGLHMATGIPVGELLLFNLFYEINPLCTSIIAESENGEIYHARNLDFGLFMGWDTKTKTWGLSEVLRPLVVNLDYRKNKKTVYKATSFAGYVGIVSGVKPGVASLTLNLRFQFGPGKYLGLIEWLLGKRTASWTSLLARDVIANAASFEEARDMLTKTKILAPIYYILGGSKSGQGVVITRSMSATLNEMSLDPPSGTWFVLETNYDPWKKPFFFDDRRTPAKKCMNKLGQTNVTFNGLFNVLSTQPVLNKLTVYTALIEVSTGKVESYIRDCKDPCSPW